EIMELICKELGVELEIKQMSFDSVLPGIQAGKYDVGVSGISVTPAREKNVKFTDPYCLAAQAIVVLEGSEIKSKADLTGKKISVQSGTTAESFCLENEYEVSAFKANADAQTAMVTGKVAAWVIDDLTAAEMVAAYNEGNPDVKLVILDEAMTTEPYAFAFNMASADLVEEINKILADLLADGTIANIFEKYNAPYTSPVA
ncbi:MAG: transporter substrate-binding domain-containing protein, partial [Oscillospiraceae bacterium]|nr:transporter substrate-binding domain-containing protein [Oscillospiraceae bacterium]